MIKLIYADDLYPRSEFPNIAKVAKNLKYTKMYFGDVTEFKFCPQNMYVHLESIVGADYSIDEDSSGSFLKPVHSQIKFDDFNIIDEWRFIVAIEDTTFNVYNHSSGAQTALDDTRFNYKNLFEWNYEINILLRKNCGLFYRPWIFHSIEEGIVQTFKLTR
jgi:hypothetical protein